VHVPNNPTRTTRKLINAKCFMIRALLSGASEWPPRRLGGDHTGTFGRAPGKAALSPGMLQIGQAAPDPKVVTMDGAPVPLSFFRIAPFTVYEFVRHLG
jgi:hypothetical protein